MFYTKPVEFELILGQRVTIFAIFIINPNVVEKSSFPYAKCCSAIYPGRDVSTHIIFHQDEPSSLDDDSCRLPLGLDPQQYGSYIGLMTLQTLVSGGFETGDAKVVVCVRSIGPQKLVRRSNRDETLDLVEVGIFDDTIVSVLKLWGEHAQSAQAFLPNQTVLLITKPRCLMTSEVSGELSIGCSTMVEVDPQFPEAHWLRKTAKSLAKKDAILTKFPEGLWDVKTAVHGPVRKLFTIAQVDEYARQHLSRNFTGKLNVIILETKLLETRRKGQLCCAEWSESRIII